MTDLVELAEACERHAEHHFAVALDSITETAVDLLDIDRGLECLVRAERLRAHAAQSKGE
jgi:hypothetical protein